MLLRSFILHGIVCIFVQATHFRRTPLVQSPVPASHLLYPSEEDQHTSTAGGTSLNKPYELTAANAEVPESQDQSQLIYPSRAYELRPTAIGAWPKITSRIRNRRGEAPVNITNWNTPTGRVPLRCTGYQCLVAYVNKIDSSYSWYDTGERLHGTDEKTGVAWTGYILNMTSLTWDVGVNYPVWWHILTIIVPEVIEFKDTGILSLDFGVNWDDWDMPIRLDNRLNPDEVADFFDYQHKSMGGHSESPEFPQIPMRQKTLQAHPWDNLTDHKLKGYTVNDIPFVGIDGGNLKNRLRELQASSHKAIHLACRTRTIVTSMLLVQNAYEIFDNDPEKLKRSQDFLKAYSYRNFMHSGATDPERISELPMLKAAVRALDTVSSYTSANIPNGGLTKFGVTGYSKLGTIVFMIGAVDERVKAIAPASINWDAYDLFARWMPPHITTPVMPMSRPGPATTQSFPRPKLRSNLRNNPHALEDLFRPTLSIQELMDKKKKLDMIAEYGEVAEAATSLEFWKLHAIIDPTAWMAKLSMPKHIIMGANDILFTDIIDHYQNFWPDLPGNKSFLQIPNCMHEKTLVRSLDITSSFFRGTFLGLTQPQIKSSYWQSKRGIYYKTITNHKPFAVYQWVGHSNRSRDFSNSVWSSMELSQAPSGMARLPSKAIMDGFVGSFVVLSFEWPEPGMVFNTSTHFWISEA